MIDEASRSARRRDATAARKAAFVAQHPAGQAIVRQHNLSLMLRLLRPGPRSRATLARESGLNKATVSSLVGELADRGLISDTGIQRQSGGRPATLVELDGARVRAVGVQLDVDQVVGLVTDLRGEVLVERAMPLDVAELPEHEALAALAEFTAKLAMGELGSGHFLAGVTLAVAGLVDAPLGLLRLAPNLGWHDVDVVGAVAPSLPDGVLAAMENEANLAAVAEYRLGGHPAGSHVLMVTGSVGVGGGLVIDGALQRGSAGFGAEIGHLLVERDGLPCGCGSRGCLETLVGLPAVLRAAVPDQAERLLVDGSLSPAERLAPVVARAQAGDAAALAGLRLVGGWLGIGLVSLVNVLNPHLVVLGGIFRELAPWVVDAAAAELDRRALGPNRQSVRLVVSEVAHPGPALGGALAALERVFVDPTLVPAN